MNFLLPIRQNCAKILNDQFIFEHFQGGIVIASQTPSRGTLGRQSLGRPLTDAEIALAAAMEAAFGEGVHDFGALAAALQARGVPAPSGDAAPWTEAKLRSELEAINAALDEAYDGTRPRA